MMCYRSAAPELFHDKSDVSSDSIPGASFSVSCHSGHPAHALLVTYQESKLAISIHVYISVLIVDCCSDYPLPD
jgi:predicted ATP-grasp superfamily ATP-dependent carboligase